MEVFLNNQIDPLVWNSIAGNKIFHRYEWLEIITSTYNLKPYFLMVTEGDEFGIYPAYIKGKFCISGPFTYVTEPFASSERMLKLLLSQANIFGREPSYKKIIPELSGEGVITAIVDISNFDIYIKNLSQKMRNQLKKANQQGFNLLNEDSVENFYNLYCKKMHQHGTPPHKKIFFERILKKFPEAKVYTAFYGNYPVASMFTMQGDDVCGLGCITKFVMWAASDSDWDWAYANYFLYWSVFRIAMSEGVNKVDLGTTSYGSGQHVFKSKWKPKFYSIKSLGSDKASRDSKYFQLASRVWRSLPFGVATKFGVHLRKYLV